MSKLLRKLSLFCLFTITRRDLATQKRTKTPFNYHQKGSSINYDGGVDSSAQQGKNLYQKNRVNFIFLLTSQLPQRQQNHQYHLQIFQKTFCENIHKTINRHGASVSLKGPIKESARRGENKARQRKVRVVVANGQPIICLLYTSPSPRDGLLSRMPSSA